jgi:hypothetical protein
LPAEGDDIGLPPRVREERAYIERLKLSLDSGGRIHLLGGEGLGGGGHATSQRGL